MRSAIFYLSAVLLAGSASATWKDFTGQLPACATKCIADSHAIIDRGCGPQATTSGDVKDELCLCQGANHENPISTCIATKCTGDDAIKIRTVGATYAKYCQQLAQANMSLLSGTDNPTATPTDASTETHTPSHPSHPVTSTGVRSVSGASIPTHGSNSTVSLSVAPTVNAPTAKAKTPISSTASGSGAEPTGLPKVAALLAGAAAAVMFL